MAKYVIDGETLTGLANAIRKVTGETRSYTPSEMIDVVTNIMETGAYILVDEDGNEIPAVYVDNETVFTATENDIRIGMTAVTEAGVTEGVKEIPAYYVTEGTRIISKDSAIFLPSKLYDYTKLQAIVCLYNKTLTDSVAAAKTAIQDKLYNVDSTTPLSSLIKNHDLGGVDFGIVNESGNMYVLRYFMYKEIY